MHSLEQKDLLHSVFPQDSMHSMCRSVAGQVLLSQATSLPLPAGWPHTRQHTLGGDGEVDDGEGPLAPGPGRENDDDEEEEDLEEEDEGNLASPPWGCQNSKVDAV